jgi:hypothetical protein
VAVVVLLFHIVRRSWGTQTALGAALVAALLPTSVMNDSSGMLEPLGVALGLWGIWAWQGGRGFSSGLALGLATMARAEAWIFSLGLVVAALIAKVSRQRMPLVVSFAAVTLLYMKVLLDQTGNPIYPLWWNFVANAVGKWEYTPITSGQAEVRPFLGVLLIAAIAGLAWSLWKRPASYMLLTYGFGYWVFVAGMLGFTSYLASWARGTTSRSIKATRWQFRLTARTSPTASPDTAASRGSTSSARCTTPSTICPRATSTRTTSRS